MNNRQKLGQKGEDLAARFLEKKGFEIRDRNWRHQRCELDIVAQYEGRLIFVEVKTKRSDEVMPPEASVGSAKRRNIVDTANRYMESVDYYDEIRFDIIAILMRSDQSHDIKHIEDAFFPGMH